MEVVHRVDRVWVAWTDRSDGDLRPDVVASATLLDRQRRLTNEPWAMLDERHGTDVYAVEAQAASTWRPIAGIGDVLVGPRGAGPVAVWVGDCAPIVLVGSEGTRVAVHAGWRGLAAGVVDVGLAELETRTESVAAAVLGPSIHPCCYEFGWPELRLVAAGIGLGPDEITSQTRRGHVALDVPSAVRAALGRRGVELDVVGPCTGCDDRFYSHRVRGDHGRHAVVTWERAS